MVGGPLQPSEQAGDEPAAEPAPTPARPPRWRRTWLSPTGLSAIAAIAAVLVGVWGLLAQNRAPSPVTGTPAADSSGPTAPPSSGGPAQTALFVYGSSMPGMARYDLISRYVDRSARDSVNGSVHDSGLGYPMAKFGGDGVVQGVVLWLDPATAEAALTEMTRVEAGLFHPVTVRTAAGVTAQAYEWIGSTDGYPRIDVWDGSTAHYGSQVGWEDLAVGDCFQTTHEDLVLTSWCEAPHALEAYHAGTVRAGTGDPRVAAEKACAAAFASFVGREQRRSELTTRVFSESASASNRPRFLCAVGVPGMTHAGSLEGSDR